MTATGLAMLVAGYGAAYAVSGLKSVWPMLLALAVTAIGCGLFMVGLVVWLWRTAP